MYGVGFHVIRFAEAHQVCRNCCWQTSYHNNSSANSSDIFYTKVIAATAPHSTAGSKVEWFLCINRSEVVGYARTDPRSCVGSQMSNASTSSRHCGTCSNAMLL